MAHRRSPRVRGQALISLARLKDVSAAKSIMPLTTRAKGTGLGLAIVKKIMEDHAGTLEMHDNPSGGARVVLCIPLEQSDPVDSAPSRQSIQSRYGA